MTLLEWLAAELQEVGHRAIELVGHLRKLPLPRPAKD